MRNLRHALETLGLASGIGIGIWKDNELTSIFAVHDSNPLCSSPNLRRTLTEHAAAQETPLIWADVQDIFFGCIRDGETYYLLGPLPARNLSLTERSDYCAAYGIPDGDARLIHSFTMAQIVSVISLAAEIILEKTYPVKDLMHANNLRTADDDTLLRDRVNHYIQDEDREYSHHTRSEEMAILDFVKEGKAENAVKWSLAMDRIVGKLSRDELTNWKYNCVVQIALCSRAAMDGDVNPATAYHYSDFYIRKLDDCTDVPSVIALRNKAITELCGQVREKKEKKVDGYVDLCMDYVSKHYREKFHIEDIARELGLSEGYLSRLFRKTTGVCLQDYIVQHRVERSTGLLSYTDMSIPDISAYVGFPSQSYFGKVFKKYTGTTPLKYREARRTREYSPQSEEME